MDEADRLGADTPVVGGDQVRDGYACDPLLGGGGARSAATWTSAVWPNVVTLEVLQGGVPLGPGTHRITVGESLSLHYVYRDYDSASSVTFTLDPDRNPYDPYETVIGSDIRLATGASLAEATVVWDTSELPEGEGNVCATITDGTHTRYLRAAPHLQLTFPQADLAISRSDGEALAIPDQAVTYTIRVSNAGPTAVTGATVTDTFPEALTGVAWSCAGSGGGSCSGRGSDNITDVVSLPVTATVVYTAAGTVNPAASGTLSNAASVSPPAGINDPDTNNNQATDSDTLDADAIFFDGFESGDTSRWSAVCP